MPTPARLAIAAFALAIAAALAWLLFRGGGPTGFEGTRPEPDPVFTGLRDLALAATVADLELGPEATNVPVWGVVMDLGLPNGVASIAAFADGKASLYLSTGGGALATPAEEPVRRAASNLVGLAARHLNSTTQAIAQPLPAAGEVAFYLLTPGGVRGAAAAAKSVEGGDHSLSALYTAGQEVLTQLRQFSERRSATLEATNAPAQGLNSAPDPAATNLPSQPDPPTQPNAPHPPATPANP